MGDARANKLIAKAQERIDDPVLAAAVVAPKGRQGAAAAGGAIGMVINSAKAADTAYGGTNVFAITDAALHAYRASNNFGIKLKEEIGCWPWGTFGASTSNGRLTQFLFIGWDDGTVKELEVHVKAGNQFQGPFVDEIVRRAAEAGATPPPIP